MNLLTESELSTVSAVNDQPARIIVSDVSVHFARPVERVPTLKEHILRRLVGHRTEYHEFRALQNVTLSVNEGETLGIIGRNGAGKSTLLRVVARVLEPTSGRLQVRGRVLPMLELGTGFSPELTGRENIYLHGALLNMPRSLMHEKFDEIVEFSELAPFIDSPLRTYSTGMTLRLAFAIASAAKPDILLMDEVLAVGDLAFETKSKARIAEFRRSGCTILFVSHSLKSVRDICTRAIWVDGGKVRMAGQTAEVIEAYEGFVKGTSV